MKITTLKLNIFCGQHYAYWKRSFILRAIKILPLFVLVFASNAWSYGFGLYGNIGTGSLEVEAEDSRGRWKFDKDTEHKGFGIVIDSSLSKDNLFNYRCSLGYERFKQKPGDGIDTLDLYSLVLDQDFGFGLLRSRRVRIWAGPEMRISHSKGKVDIDPNFKVTLIGFGLGPAVGLNLNLDKNVTLAVKVSYLTIAYAGEGKDQSTNVDYSQTGNLFLLNLSLFFRVNE